MRPAGKRDDPRRPPSSSSAADDYRAKVEYEISTFSQRSESPHHPAPLGDPSSGVVLVIEQPVGPRTLQALSLSLQAVNLTRAYVTFASTDTLAEEILATEPHALAAVGPAAARKIDALDHPLARNAFSEATPGVWFAWTRGTAGLLLPPLAPALDDDTAKRRFWQAFLSFRDLSPA